MPDSKREQIQCKLSMPTWSSAQVNWPYTTTSVQVGVDLPEREGQLPPSQSLYADRLMWECVTHSYGEIDNSMAQLINYWSATCLLYSDQVTLNWWWSALPHPPLQMYYMFWQIFHTAYFLPDGQDTLHSVLFITLLHSDAASCPQDPQVTIPMQCLFTIHRKISL